VYGEELVNSPSFSQWSRLTFQILESGNHFQAEKGVTGSSSTRPQASHCQLSAYLSAVDRDLRRKTLDLFRQSDDTVLGGMKMYRNLSLSILVWLWPFQCTPRHLFARAIAREHPQTWRVWLDSRFWVSAATQHMRSKLQERFKSSSSWNGNDQITNW